MGSFKKSLETFSEVVEMINIRHNKKGLIFLKLKKWNF
jgi:hypothetical protein